MEVYIIRRLNSGTRRLNSGTHWPDSGTRRLIHSKNSVLQVGTLSETARRPTCPVCRTGPLPRNWPSRGSRQVSVDRVSKAILPGASLSRSCRSPVDQSLSRAHILLDHRPPTNKKRCDRNSRGKEQEQKQSQVPEHPTTFAQHCTGCCFNTSLSESESQ